MSPRVHYLQAGGRRSSSNSGQVDRVLINEAVLRRAQKMAGQDLARLVLRRDGLVIVDNTPGTVEGRACPGVMVR
jgi:hypothetical protein